VVPAQAAPAMSMWFILPTSRPADIEQLDPRRSIPIAAGFLLRRQRAPGVGGSSILNPLSGSRASRRRRSAALAPTLATGGAAPATLAFALLVCLLVPTDGTQTHTAKGVTTHAPHPSPPHTHPI
jgi:hypothetical protein